MTNTSRHSLDKSKRFIAPGIAQGGFTHELNDLPSREAIRILGLLCFELVEMRLQSHEGAPFRFFDGSCFAAQEQLHQETNGIWQNIRIQELEDFAFVFVVGFPCFGLAGLVEKVSWGVFSGEVCKQTRA